MRALLGSAVLLWSVAAAASAATFEESFDLVRGEARQAYLRLEPVEAWVKPDQRLPLTDPSIPTTLEPGARRQKAERLLAALTAIQELQGRPGAAALTPARKTILTRTIKLGLELDENDQALAVGLYQASRPGIPPPLSDFVRAQRIRTQAAGAIDRATTGAGAWKAPAAGELASAAPPANALTPRQLAALNAVPPAQSRISDQRIDVPLPSLQAQARLAAAQRAAADGTVRENWEKRYAADGHVLNDWQASWDKSADQVSGPRRWLDKAVAFGLGIPNDAQRSLSWWWYSRDKAELSPHAKLDAAGDVVVQAAMMVPVGRGLGLAAKAGETVLAAEARTAALRVAQLQAKVDAKQALTRAESHELSELTKGQSDLVFHTTTAENMDKIRQSGRVAATTEKFVYGSRRQITNLWRQLLSGVSPKEGLIVFQGDAAKLFQGHAVKGGYSALKRGAGQQITNGAGDVIITKASYNAETKTLTVLEARMPTEGERRFILQSPGWAQTRYMGRVLLLDGALTTAVGFSALPMDTQLQVLQYTFGSHDS